MQLGLSESLWPKNTANAVERAQEFHVGRFGRWLQVAGAEPRLALILCAGARAKLRLVELLEAAEIEVCVRSATNARPLPKDVLEHHGDHFNRRLFLIDGLDECNRREVLATLNGQRSQLRRMATWVGLVIESPDTLATLYEVGQGLVNDVMRRCLVIDLDQSSSVHTSAPAAQVNLWRSRGAIAELAFHTACTRGETADYHDVSRLFRTGYAASVPPPHAPLLETAMELVHTGHAPLPAEASPDILSAHARHGHLTDSARDRVSAALVGRPFCRLAAELPPQAPWEQLIADVSRFPSRLSSEPADVAAMIEAACPKTAWGSVIGQLTAAQLAASQGNVRACGEALEALVGEASQPRVAPEVYFNALEYRVRFEVGLSRRAQARAILDRLEHLEPRLESPLYAARTCLARGDFTVALDPVMANEEYREAERLFSRYGYPDWAEQALARQEKIR